ncbi:DinB family protein [Mesobacillus stamsii]|uniref:Damage-inducible protein DinB n=1 Tax=Mesobacillus stamsii TaxID=225347 RepID=A0ABU0FTY5_9BACI|nr:DinB family protein [Mesobacillus stamsii]MDQ0412838.1 putative damage-inducible protein DinB [Mesobacillus stamsii]
MSELLFKQFALTRQKFLQEIEGLNREQVSFQPEGFNNNIHWNTGHVLTVTEQFMMGYPEKSNHLPGSYIELFGNGTRPSDWTGNVPSVEELANQLKAQLERINEVPSSMLDQKLEQPIFGLETLGELANRSLFHETYHLGQIHAMKRLIK